MKSGKCPKCSQNTVYMSRKGITFHSNSAMYIQNLKSIMTVPFDNYNNYVCASCGYFETYIDDKEKLSEIQKHWSKM